MAPIVSIVIPCYNHGEYIDDAIRSVEQLEQKDLYEIIIVNDGSKDAFTNEHLTKLSEHYHIIDQPNGGLAAARNMGISKAKGKYILPLDADNMIRPEYVLKGIAVMENNPDISVVYGDALLFGEATGVRKSLPFNLQRLMLANTIDACAIYRKEIWIANNGYDGNMRSFQGYEDWEFWLNASFKGYKFHYIEEVLYDYRVLKTSMINRLNSEKKKNDMVIDYIAAKHAYYMGPQFIDEYFLSKAKKSLLGFCGKVVLKTAFPKLFSSFVQRGKLRKYL